MRIRAIVLMTAGVLFCSLATIELVELLNLVDDTSNDYVLASSEETGRAVIQNPGSRVAFSPVAPHVANSPGAGSSVRIVSHVPSPPVYDLLHSLCIQRT